MSISRVQILDWFRKPKDYASQLQIVSQGRPFGSDLTRALVLVRLEVESKGDPKTFAMMCPLNESDYSSWSQGVSSKQPWSGFAQSVNCVQQREVVGLATVGLRSYYRGKGFALGFIPAQKLAGLLCCAIEHEWSRFDLILIRNPTSFQYRIAHFSV
jgi:glycine cleavage system aminomethyltransferase T